MEKMSGPFSISKRISVNKPGVGINHLPETDYVVLIHCMKINRKNFCRSQYCINREGNVSRCTICLDAAKGISRAAKRRRAA